MAQTTTQDGSAPPVASSTHGDSFNGPQVQVTTAADGTEQTLSVPPTDPAQTEQPPPIDLQASTLMETTAADGATQSIDTLAGFPTLTTATDGMVHPIVTPPAGGQTEAQTASVGPQTGTPTLTTAADGSVHAVSGGIGSPSVFTGADGVVRTAAESPVETGTEDGGQLDGSLNGVPTVTESVDGSVATGAVSSFAVSTDEQGRPIGSTETGLPSQTENTAEPSASAGPTVAPPNVSILPISTDATLSTTALSSEHFGEVPVATIAQSSTVENRRPQPSKGWARECRYRQPQQRMVVCKPAKLPSCRRAARWVKDSHKPLWGTRASRLLSRDPKYQSHRRSRHTRGFPHRRFLQRLAVLQGSQLVNLISAPAQRRLNQHRCSISTDRLSRRLSVLMACPRRCSKQAARSRKALLRLRLVLMDSRCSSKLARQHRQAQDSRQLLLQAPIRELASPQRRRRTRHRAVLSRRTSGSPPNKAKRRLVRVRSLAEQQGQLKPPVARHRQTARHQRPVPTIWRRHSTSPLLHPLLLLYLLLLCSLH